MHISDTGFTSVYCSSDCRCGTISKQVTTPLTDEGLIQFRARLSTMPDTVLKAYAHSANVRCRSKKRRREPLSESEWLLAEIHTEWQRRYPETPPDLLLSNSR
jgi:hypothetical protein